MPKGQWTTRERPEKKERNAQVIALRKQGLKYRAIAARFGITFQRARYIVKRHQRRQQS